MKDLKYGTVIFDLDGTLIRSEEGIYRSLAYACERLDIALPEQPVLKRFIGPPLHYSFTHFMGLDDQTAERAVGYYRERYLETGLFEAAVFTGLPALLRQLKRAGASLAVATTKPAGPAELILSHFRLAHFFDRVLCADRLAVHTEKEALIRAAAVGQPGPCVMVGDRLYDIVGAQAAGIDSIGVGYGYGSETELKDAGCTLYAPTVTSLSAVLFDNPPAAQGLFISVEGLDGSGKTSQMDALEAGLVRCGFDVERSREPGGCAISEKIRALVLGRENTGMCAETEALLYAAARAQHVAEVINPALAAGKLLLCDRYVDSSIAYQGGGRGLGIQRVADINRFATGGTMPDITVYLDISAQDALSRRISATELDRIEIEALSFHQKVEDAFRCLSQGEPARYVVIPASGAQDEVASACLTGVLDRIAALDGGR